MSYWLERSRYMRSSSTWRLSVSRLVSSSSISAFLASTSVLDCSSRAPIRAAVAFSASIACLSRLNSSLRLGEVRYVCCPDGVRVRDGNCGWGFLWGRRELLEKLPTFREDFIPDEPPGKIEAGTFVYENVAGMDAAVRYLETLGRSLGGNDATAKSESRRGALQRAFEAIRVYEESLSLEMLRVLNDCGAVVYGLSEEERIGQRVPTLCFNLPNVPPSRVAEEFG